MLVYYDSSREIRGYMDATSVYLVGPVRGESVVLAETNKLTTDPDELFAILQALGVEAWHGIHETNYLYSWRRRRSDVIEPSYP